MNKLPTNKPTLDAPIKYLERVCRGFLKNKQPKMGSVGEMEPVKAPMEAFKPSGRAAIVSEAQLPTAAPTMVPYP